ncbi:hypothetical protein JQ594_28770 [Bradyrhizobium manausense]|uniref:hypothetical protein n=1 Tax=Bradyrhizobium manausense TaxID=989370 RepID=UPI001BA7928A|nr:hypothetical protein [Bradyrhizobium manausense]MBR0689935.1 hypothetical protein [Bradyrhizobium manausense]
MAVSVVYAAGAHKMQRRCNSGVLTQAERLGSKYAQLSPEEQAIVTAEIRRIIAQERDQ